MRRLCLVIAIQIAFVAGCGRTYQGVQRSSEQPGEKKELLIFVGAGIRPPVAELADKFIELACSKRGREIFKRHNYRVAPPE